MVGIRARSRSAQAGRTTNRQRVLSVVADAQASMTGHEIATRAALTYRQTIDALNDLLNQGRIARTGRKFSARWAALAPLDDPSAALQVAIFNMSRPRKHP